MSKYRILSIDAWAGPCMDSSHTEENCDCNNWEWNNWFNTGVFYYESEYGELTEDTALQCIADKLGGSPKEVKENFYIEDDQYNMVLCDKKDHKPIYAIEYGSEY